MELLDESTMTAEQKFIFMLEERLSEVETELNKMKIALYGVNKLPLPQFAQDAVKSYKDIYMKQEHDELAQKKEVLRNELPEHIFDIVTDNVINDFHNILWRMDKTPELKMHSSYNIYRIIEKLGDKTTPELIEWFDVNFREMCNDQQKIDRNVQ